MNVSGPATPSAARPFFACHSMRAFSVAIPKVPSASTPSLSWSLFTGSPERPFLRIAMEVSPTCELLARHLRFQKANHRGRETAADTASKKRADNGADIEAGGGGCTTNAEDRAQNLAANASS